PRRRMRRKPRSSSRSSIRRRDARSSRSAGSSSNDPSRPLTSEDFSILLLTVEVATVATLLILPIGVAAGWLLSRGGGPLRTFAETVVSLPLVLPPTAVGILLLEALRKRGTIGGFLDS